MDTEFKEILDTTAQRYEAIGIVSYAYASTENRRVMLRKAELVIKKIRDKPEPEERDLSGMTEDEQLDDPRHGQAAAINSGRGFQ